MVLLAALLLLFPQDKKLPVPDTAAQKEAEKQIRGSFKEEYAKKTPSDRIALAKKLLQQGLDTSDSPGTRYVLLREASDLAALGGDTGIPLQAIGEIARHHEIPWVEMKSAALATASKSMRLIDEFGDLAKRFLDLVEEALAAEEYDSAEKAASTGAQFARKGKNASLQAKLEARGKEAVERRIRAAKVGRALETIAKNANDGEARLVAGYHLAVVKGDWEQGLAHLARCNDAGYKSAAEKDLAQPSEAAARVTAGDAWWELGEKTSGAAQGRLRSRAGHWYLKAREQLSGPSRARVDQRLQAAGMLPPEKPSIDLLKLLDPDRDAVYGRWEMKDGALISPQIAFGRLQVPYSPPEEYDLEVVVESEQEPGSLNLGLVGGNSRVMAVIDGGNPKRSMLSVLEDPAEGEAVHQGKSLAVGKPNTVLCSVRRERLTVKVNDKLILDWPADYARCKLEQVWSTPNPKALVLAGFNSIFRFTKVSLVPVTGEGKSLR